MRVDINDEGHIWAAYTGLGRDWNSFGQRVGYPLEIQAKAEADYFMVMFFFLGVLSLLLMYNVAKTRL